MSRAKKCDICSAVYDEYPTEKNIHIDSYERVPGGPIGVNEMDCCPKCSAAILNLVDVMKTYPDRWIIDILNEDWH